MKVCPQCSNSILRPHPEFIWWKKCGICAYCEIAEDLSQQDAELAKNKPFTKYPQAAALEAVEAERIRRDLEDLVPVWKKP